ncbi:MAG: DNA-3-methyladenine glycosylase [Candidatus Carbobacillus sp.]|nr:DNA-3-methyladenine glycosylase [Candidatus Carbobacillus sp.]
MRFTLPPVLTPLPSSFYERSTLALAQALLGQLLVHETPEGRMVGKIVETEAYIGPYDKAAHSYNDRRTKRTEVMYGPAGVSYIYLIYGMYECLNVTASQEGKPHAILIRALEPIEGLALMQKNRPKARTLTALTSGPGRLTQALGITRELNGHELRRPPLYLAQGTHTPLPQHQIARGPRIGIHYAQEARHFPWRFWIKDHPFVSKVKHEPREPLR